MTHDVEDLKKQAIALAAPVLAAEQVAALLALRRFDEPLWRALVSLDAEPRLSFARDTAFPSLRSGHPFSEALRELVFLIPTAARLDAIVSVIDKLAFVGLEWGDFFEAFVASVLSTHACLRIPRADIVQDMLHLVAPRPGERIVDLACGSGALLVGAWEYVRSTCPPTTREAEDVDWKQSVIAHESTKFAYHVVPRCEVTGFEGDRRLAVLAAINFAMHEMQTATLRRVNAATADFDSVWTDDTQVDVVIADCSRMGRLALRERSRRLDLTTDNGALLLLARTLQVLKPGGRAAVIVPEEVLTRMSRAHTALRQRLLDEAELRGVVPGVGGAGDPASSLLVFVKGETTESACFSDDAREGAEFVERWRRRRSGDIEAPMASAPVVRVAENNAERGLAMAEAQESRVEQLARPEYRSAAISMRDALRDARSAVLADAEGFLVVVTAIEGVGRWLTPERDNLGWYRGKLVELVRNTLGCDDAARFEREYYVLTQTRNDEAHGGAAARHATAEALRVSIVLEEALLMVTKNASADEKSGPDKAKKMTWRDVTAAEVMTLDLVVAQHWQLIADLRRTLLVHGYSWIPYRERGESEWRLISDVMLAKWLHESDARDQRMRQCVSRAVNDGLATVSAVCVERGLRVPALTMKWDPGNQDPAPALIPGALILVTSDGTTKGDLLGVIAPADIL